MNKYEHCFIITEVSNEMEASKKISSKHILISVVYIICFIILITAKPIYAAGGAGHYYIARNAAGIMMEDINIPPEIRDALKDSACMNSFCNGAIAPDLSCLVDKSHYGDTSYIPLRMMDISENFYRKALALSDGDNSKQAKIKESLKWICFTVGWMSHCATDIAIHPKVNSRSGDAYEYCNNAQKAIHAAAEVQFTKYLISSYKNSAWKISFDIPYKLLSEAANISTEKLEASVKTMRIKIIGELAAANQVKIPMAELSKEWTQITKTSINKTIEYIKDPDKFKKYGLDYGEITTTDFRSLRTECININNGKVPKAWGNEYLNWWNIVRSMDPWDRHEKLTELIHGKKQEQKNLITAQIKTSGPIYYKLWINDKELTSTGYTEFKVKQGGNITVKAQAYESNRMLCMEPAYKGNYVTVIAKSPYILHYRSEINNSIYEYCCKLLSETYEWRPQNSNGITKSSNDSPFVKNDIFIWTIPALASGTSSPIYKIDIECDMLWSHYSSTMANEQQLSALNKMSLLIKLSK